MEMPTGHKARAIERLVFYKDWQFDARPQLPFPSSLK